MFQVRAGCTVKLTVNDRAGIFTPDTVTVAVYVPAARPVRGCTEKLVLSPAARLQIKCPLMSIGELNIWKLPGFVPDSVTRRFPVG